MKKFPPLLLLIAVIFVFSACSPNSVKIHPDGKIAYLLVSDKITADYGHLTIKDSLLLDKSNGRLVCSLKAKPMVFLFSDNKSKIVALPMTRQRGSKLGIQGNYFYIIDTITDKNLLSITDRQESEIIEAFIHPGQQIQISGSAIVSYLPNKILGENNVSRKDILFSDGKPNVSKSQRIILWPMVELIITALVIFLLARAVTLNCLGIKDWKQRHKLSYKKWSRMSNKITAGLWIILFAFEFSDVIWGTVSVYEGILVIVVLIAVNSLISVTVSTLLTAVLTLPYQAITWFVFTALIVWAVKSLTGHVWQIYLPFTGYFAWLIWLNIKKQKDKKSAKITKRFV